MKKTFIIHISMLFMLAGTAAAEKMPDWTKGKSKQYPKDTYITGVGSGDTLDAARSSARAEIAKVFNVRVAQLARDSNKEKSAGRGSKKRETISETQVSTEVSTDQLLEGVEIPETWYSEKKKTYYALATLDKLKMRSELSQKILDAEEAAGRKLAKARNESTALKKLRACSEALEAVKIKQDLAAKKRIIDPAAVPDVLSASEKNEIESMRKEEMANIIFVMNTGTDGTGLNSLIGAKITGMGFSVIDKIPEHTRQKASYITVRCGMEVSPLDKKSPEWKFYDWSVSGFMNDSSNPGENFAIISKRGQSSHLTDEAARNKAVTEASNALAQEIEQQINKNIFGKE